MDFKLPGQKKKHSKKLQDLFREVQAECDRGIVFRGSLLEPGFEANCRIEETEIIISIRDDVPLWISECLAAHELCHARQYSEGYAMLSAPKEEVELFNLSTLMSNFILDTSADSMVVALGFPISKAFRILEEEQVMDSDPHKSLDGRSMGNNWQELWANLMDRLSPHC